MIQHVQKSANDEVKFTHSSKVVCIFKKQKLRMAHNLFSKQLPF